MVSRLSALRLKHSRIRGSLTRLSVLQTVRVAVRLNVVRVESQSSIVVVVLSVLPICILSVLILSVLSVLSILSVLGILSVLIILALALSELALGDTGCKQQWQQGRETHCRRTGRGAEEKGYTNEWSPSRGGLR